MCMIPEANVLISAVNIISRIVECNDTLIHKYTTNESGSRHHQKGLSRYHFEIITIHY